MSAALFSALKSSPTKLFSVKSPDKIANVLLKYMTSDRANLVENGVLGVGFYLSHFVMEDKPIPQNLLVSFVKVSVSSLKIKST